MALIRLGCETITALDDGTTEATVMNAIYEQEKNSLLCAYNWRFCTFTVELARLKEMPKVDYKYAYQLPNDFLIVKSVTEGSYDRDFGIVKNSIVTDAESPLVTYTPKMFDHELPDYFTGVLADRLAAVSAIALTGGSTTIASYYQKVFDVSFARAKSQDAMQATCRVFDNNLLLACRS